LTEEFQPCEKVRITGGQFHDISIFLLGVDDARRVLILLGPFSSRRVLSWLGNISAE
jgi:hypothetical protein